MSQCNEMSRIYVERGNLLLDDDNLIATDANLTPKTDSQCSTCKKMVSFGVFFCPYCGAVNLQNMLIKGKIVIIYMLNKKSIRFP